MSLSDYGRKESLCILIFNERECMKMSSFLLLNLLSQNYKTCKIFNRFVACWSQLFSKQEGIKQMVRTGGRG